MAGSQVLPAPIEGGGSGAPTDAQYVVLSADGTLTDERILTAGTNITLTDNGAGSTLVIAASGGGGGTPASTVVSETTYGQSPAVGTSTDYARADHTHGTPSAGGLSNFLGLFGDGGDGNATITGTTTLTREMHYDNLTVNNGGVLKPAGNRIFVRGTLTVNAGGSINDDGTSATSHVGPTGFAARNYLGASGTNAGSGWSVVSAQSAAGNAGVANTNSSPNSANVLPAGGAGGSTLTRVGGAGGAAPANASFPQRWSGRILDGRGSFGAFNGGAGGGGGAASVGTYTGGTFISGGGGSGAGIVWIAAATISNSGTISARGGNGANASAGTGSGDVGGGGGGGGGLVGIITKSATVGGTVSVAGGTGGTGAGVGGNVGGNGTAGADGFYHLLVLG